MLDILLHLKLISERNWEVAIMPIIGNSRAELSCQGEMNSLSICSETSDLNYESLDLPEEPGFQSLIPSD